MAYLVTTEGIAVSLRVHHAVVESGPFRGTVWRIDELFHDGTDHCVRASRKHRAGRVRGVFHPSVFGLMVQEEFTRIRRVVNRLQHMLRTVDEGLIMGTLALLPLAAFEAYHGGEVTREFLTHLLGG